MALTKIKIDITGVSPLLQHNVQLADPDNKWAREIAAVTSKRKKTPEDREKISYLEFMGSLYTENGRVVMPTSSVRKSAIKSAAVTRQGKQVERALVLTDVNIPLEYKGPKDIKTLGEDLSFRHKAVVTVGQSKLVRTRPIFNEWALSLDVFLEESILDFDDFVTIITQAGLIERLGDNRANGFGRYEAEVTRL